MATFHASDGAAIAYDDRGPTGGFVLLLLHGWYGSRAIWDRLRERLDDRVRTIAIDLRGFGESHAAPGPYTVDVFASDLSDAIAALDLDPVVVVGHALGGAVAQRFAIDRPDAVEGLVLCSPVPPSGVPLSAAHREALRATAGTPELIDAWLGTLLQPDPPRELVATLRAAAADASPDAARESLDSWTSLDFEDDARTIDTPTLVVAPALDRPLTPAFLRERVAGVIDGARFDVLRDAGHFAPLERADEIAARIETFVEAL